ncbi:MAG: DNA replication/repair protein RecF, partial [Alphaproteobacteria bacterium]
MYIKDIHLRRFRNHSNCAFEFEGKFTLFYGRNGAGKTNILEAISLLSIGAGLRKVRLEEMGQQQKETFLPWKVEGNVVRKDLSFKIQTNYDREKNTQREIYIDDKKRPQKDLADFIRFVVLTPTLDKIFMEGSQAIRRLIDRMISVFDPDHIERLSKYNQLLKERYVLCEKEICSAWLGVNAKILAEHAVPIAIARLDYIERLNTILTTQQTHFPEIRLSCDGWIEKSLETQDALDVEEKYTSYLQDNVELSSVNGVHRSQFMLFHVSKNQSVNLCSTGEQKTMLLSLLLGQVALLHSILGEPPVFLLDEGGAHLDDKNQRILFEELKSLKAQTIITNVEDTLFKNE